MVNEQTDKLCMWQAMWCQCQCKQTIGAKTQLLNTICIVSHTKSYFSNDLIGKNKHWNKQTETQIYH